MVWFTKKKQCVHCRKNKTKRDFEEQPTCGECHMDILIKREEKRKCPADGELLEKHKNGQIILDVCPKCQGIWLDAGELEVIKEAAQEEGMGSGVAIGMIIG